MLSKRALVQVSSYKVRTFADHLVTIKQGGLTLSRSLVTLMTFVSPSQDFITRYVTNIECIRPAIFVTEGGGGGGGGGGGRRESEGKRRGGGSEDENDEVDDYANERAIRAITPEIGFISER